MGTGGLLAGLPGMGTHTAAAISGKPSTTCLYSSPPPITSADSAHSAFAVATVSGDGMKAIIRGRSATRPPQRSSSLTFVSNMDAACVEEQMDAEVAKMTQFCDEMIALYERPQSKARRKLLVFRDEWNKYRGSFHERLQFPADMGKEAIVNHTLLSLAGKMRKVALDRRCMETGALFYQEKDLEFDACLRYLERQLLYGPGFWCLLPTSYIEEKASSLKSIDSVVSNTNVDAEIEKQSMVKDTFNGVIPSKVLALAKEAVLASREAASLAESHSTDHVNDFYFPGQDPKGLAKVPTRVEEATVRSKRFLERRSMQHRIPNKMTTVIQDSAACTVSTEMSKKISKGLSTSDPRRLFLRGPETKQLLTVKEERDLFNKIQDLMRLEEVKQKLQLQFGREPTFTEWAEAVGMSSRVLQSCLYSGNCSREKMIYANFRLVVHVAKQYQGKGLNIQDLLQEGSMGLMKSLEKFKPKAGCRFPTYAYWWIRQSIRKAIFQNSRTIRLPENVFALLKKVKNVRKLYIQEGHIPTNEDLARRVGITKERLERLLASARTPVSIQDSAWIDQDITFQEITADPEVEVPELSVAKQMMRQHVRSLLRVLPPRERQIIQFRYGIHDGKPNSLSDIGALLGLSKERVRQLESRALDRLKEGLTSHGLGAYVDLLI